MRSLDAQEKKIITELIKDPRSSDNKIGKNSRVPIRTVSRKRNRLEEEGLISYYTNVNMGSKGTGRFGARQLYLIKFRLGITREQMIKEIKEEKMVKLTYGRYIYESFLGEIEGHVALALILEGRSSENIVEHFNRDVIPSLRKNHGKNSIEEVSTMRLSEQIRLFHNYLPMVNMERGYMKKDWLNDLIFVE
ncbi:MAG TPA: winged helix-turn-helix transcriptional regulator [Candidatus Nanoarchaeia archaeon]|nr:winged helix-turn-helix transcriptional regulator [Candidatus Nanoarchaeia archaeon]